jgi:hypothetical protein
MILSYSLDVRHVPLHILFLNFMFSYLNFIIVDFFSLSCNPDSGIEEGQRRHVNINRLKNKHHIAILKNCLGCFAPGKNSDETPAAPAPTLLYGKIFS